MAPPESPALTDCSVLSPHVGPRHMGQVDNTRELLDVVDEVHSTGCVLLLLEANVRTLADSPAASVLMSMFPRSASLETRVSGSPQSSRQFLG